MGFRFAEILVVAFSGLTLFLVVLAVKEAGRRSGAAFAMGWAVPGLGHIVMGKWRKGLFFFFLLGALHLFGLWITGFRPVSFEDNPFYFLGRYGSGLTLLIPQILPAGKAYPNPAFAPCWYEPGLLFICVAGLLNYVVALSVLDFKPAGPVEAPKDAEDTKTASGETA